MKRAVCVKPTEMETSLKEGGVLSPPCQGDPSRGSPEASMVGDSPPTESTGQLKQIEGGASPPPIEAKSDESIDVRLADELDTIVEQIQHYFSLPDPAVAMLMACWIANTHNYNAFRYTGYLTLRSATPRCGKTRLLRFIGVLSRGAPKPTTAPTAAVLYRSKREVLLLDEVDGLRNRDKDTHGMVVAVLNVGFEEGGMIERLEKDEKGNFTVQEFPVYGPKALAGIENVTDTIADRAFVIEMYRSDQRMPRLNMRKLESDFRVRRERLARWAEAHQESIRARYDDLPSELPELSGFDDRFQDISEPLVVLATVADEERPKGPLILPRLLEGLRAVAGRRTVSSRERGLRVILDIFESRWEMDMDADKLVPKEDLFMGSEDLLEECQRADELNWIGSTTALAGFLKHFELHPSRDTHGQRRGYRVTNEWVQRWRKSYGKEAGAV
jgi:hypothetical protein